MVLISYFKSMNGKVTEIESCEPGCWIRCIAPTNDEINSLIAEFAIEPDFFRAAMDEEESSHIDIEDESTLLIVDIPVLDRPHEKITYSTTPLGIIITQSNVITVSTKESPILSEIAPAIGCKIIKISNARKLIRVTDWVGNPTELIINFCKYVVYV